MNSQWFNYLFLEDYKSSYLVETKDFFNLSSPESCSVSFDVHSNEKQLYRPHPKIQGLKLCPWCVVLSIERLE